MDMLGCNCGLWRAAGGFFLPALQFPNRNTRSPFRNRQSGPGNGSRSFPALTIVILLLANLTWAQATRAELPSSYELADLKALQLAFSQLAETVRPSVVAIRTYRTIDPGLSDRALVKIPLSQGSGFVMDADGFIVTNRHVIQDADLIIVRFFDGTASVATVRQADVRSDLAVLHLDVQGLKPIRWGDLRNVKVNQWAFACGNPFGLANDDGRASVTFGVISALGRHMTRRLVGDSEIEYYGNLIETSASISPGNSGGPLFNIDGEVVGIVAAIETSSGVTSGHGFAIPVDKNTRRILATLKAGQVVRYGFLGIEVEEVDPIGPVGFSLRGFSPARPHSVKAVARLYAGARITAIRIPNGPAARAGLRPRDIVIEIDGVPVQSADHLVRLVGFTPVGTRTVVTYLRGGVKRRATVTVADRMDLLSKD